MSLEIRVIMGTKPGTGPGSRSSGTSGAPALSPAPSTCTPVSNQLVRKSGRITQDHGSFNLACLPCQMLVPWQCAYANFLCHFLSSHALSTAPCHMQPIGCISGKNARQAMSSMPNMDWFFCRGYFLQASNSFKSYTPEELGVLPPVCHVYKWFTADQMPKLVFKVGRGNPGPKSGCSL
eukprot:scaffold278350_cov19-Tisochrysis_lutea.AAC.1